MDYLASQTVAVWAGVAVSVAINLRNSGARDQRLKDVEKVGSDHRIWLQTHDSRLNNHDMELATTRGFREGFNAAKKSPDKQER